MTSHQLNYETIIKKQEIWRLKQFSIYYGSGRPIFNIDTNTEHLRYHRSPYYFKDINKRIPICNDISNVTYMS